MKAKLKTVVYNGKNYLIEERLLSDSAFYEAKLAIANIGLAYELLPTAFIESLGFDEQETTEFFDITYYLWNSSCGLKFCKSWEDKYRFVKKLAEKYGVEALSAVKEDIKNTFDSTYDNKEKVESKIDELVSRWINKQKKKMFTRSGITKDLREIVLKRDEHKCQVCGSIDELTIDHIISFSKGGSNHPDNLQVLCKTCNIKKHAKFLLTKKGC